MNQFEAIVFDNPFRAPIMMQNIPVGQTVAEILSMSGIDLSMRLSLVVKVTKGALSSEVPIQHWNTLRPAAGSAIEVYPRIQGPVALAAALNLAVTAAAPLLATTLGFTAGTLPFALAVAGISIVGALLVNSLVPPPTVPTLEAEDPTYSISGASNSASPYTTYPRIVGRRRFFPVKTAAGYTETVNGEVYLRERMTFGYGPVAISDLRIGDTPITEFEDVEVEFLNVDEFLSKQDDPTLVSDENTFTLAGITWTTGRRVVAWRKQSETMTLYPSDVQEAGYSVVVEPVTAVTRATSINTSSAQIDISFAALGSPNSDGGVSERTVEYSFGYRKVGAGGAFTPAGALVCSASTRQFVRFTHSIEFPDADEWLVEITRTTARESDGLDTGTLTSIRSMQEGGLPSNPNIAEVALRIKATDELNGRIQSLNAIVHQLAPVHDGTSWLNELNWRQEAGQWTSNLAKVEHPAWSFAHVLRGPYLERPVSDARIGIDDLVAWAQQEPHWRCDHVFTGDVTVKEALRFIAATGRAKFSMVDLKWSIVRDGAAGGVVQHFTPRNSYGFTGQKMLNERPHGFRVKFVSESKGWVEDQITVYNDGYSAANATNVEELTLPGVVIRSDDLGQANVWKLARYYLAVASLRNEQFSFSADLDALRCQYGSKIRLVHDVPLFGVGAGRIKSWAGSEIRLDEKLDVLLAGNFRMRVRRSDGSEIAFLVFPDANDPAVWSTDGTGVIAYDIEPDDLVMIEETTSEPVDLLVTNIESEGDLKAKVTAVMAAPEVLTADTGGIPSYDPQVTVGYQPEGPPRPIVQEVLSNFDTAVRERDKSLSPRISVRIAPLATLVGGDVVTRIRWRRNVPGEKWSYSYDRPVTDLLYTGRLVAGEDYQVFVQTRDAETLKSKGWTAAGLITASIAGPAITSPQGWSATSGIDTVTLVRTAGDEDLPDFKEYRFYSGLNGDPSTTFIGTSTGPSFIYRPPGDDSVDRYKISWVNHDNEESPLTAWINVTPTGVDINALGQEISDDIQAARDEASEALALIQDTNVFLSSNVSLVASLDGDGKVAGIRAVAADTDGTLIANATVLELLGDQVIAQGSLSANRLLVGLGGNMFENSEMENGLHNYTHTGAGAVHGETSLVVRNPGQTYAGANYPTMALFQDGVEAAGTSGGRSRKPSKTGFRDARQIPVTAGDWYEFSVAVSTLRCAGLIIIFFVDETGVIVQTPSTPLPDNVAGSNVNPAAWTRYWTGPRQAPPTAKFAHVEVRKTGTTSGATSFIFWHQPQFAETHEAATLPIPYNPKGSTLITGGRIETGSIGTEELEADEIITKDLIVDGANSKRYFDNIATDLTIDDSQDIVNTGLGFDVDFEPGNNPALVTLFGRARSGHAATDVAFIFRIQGRSGGIWSDLETFQSGYFDQHGRSFTEIVPIPNADLVGVDRLRVLCEVNIVISPAPAYDPEVVFTKLGAHVIQVNK